MRVALIAPPFIEIPPRRYGGTELFIASLAEGLKNRGHEVVVYANGESTINTEVRWIHPNSHWPVTGELSENLKEISHTEWAVRDARETCDVIHLNNVFGLPHSRFVSTPFVYTVHHAHDAALSEFYSHYPDAYYVTISDFQRTQETMPRLRRIHHGINLSLYQLREKKEPYLSFLGRIAPVKGTHLAIAVAKKSGIPLKIAGEVQPVFRDYYEREVKPHVDGRFIEYLGEADLATKNELLGNSVAMLFPIQWDEPFGLVMIEAMACGTPVLALPGGSVRETVRNGISGYVCESVSEMAEYARNLGKSIRPDAVRYYAEQRFSLDRMAAECEEVYSSCIGPELLQPFGELLQIAEGEAPAARGH